MRNTCCRYDRREGIQDTRDRCRKYAAENPWLKWLPGRTYSPGIDQWFFLAAGRREMKKTGIWKGGLGALLFAVLFF